MTNYDDYDDNYTPNDTFGEFDDPDGDAVPVPEEVGGIPTGLPPARKRKRTEAPPVPEVKPRRRAPFYIMVGCLLTCCACCVLPFGALTIGGVTLASVFSRSEVVETGTIDIPLDEELSPSILIDVPVGGITLQSGSVTDSVTINLTKKAYSWNETRAQQELEDIEIEAYQDSETGQIVIRALQGDWSNDLLNNANSVDMTITVPDTAYDSIAINGNVGDQEITNIEVGTLKLETNVGALTFSGDLTAEDAQSSLTSNVGEIIVRLPATAYLAVTADVDVGELNISWPGTVPDIRESPAGRSWEGTLGTGDNAPSHHLDLKTSVGEISITTR